MPIFMEQPSRRHSGNTKAKTGVPAQIRLNPLNNAQSTSVYMMVISDLTMFHLLTAPTIRRYLVEPEVIDR
jgi:hypothetical protein